MSDENQKKPEIPRRMSKVAFPNAKYGVYLAIFIILIVLIVSASILCIVIVTLLSS